MALALSVVGAAWLQRSPAAPHSAGKVLVIGTEGAYPPWNFQRADGRLDGFEPELIPLVCARAGLQCRMQAMDWDGMVAALQTGKIDAIADSVQITPERRAVLGFTRPYARTTGVFVTQAGNPLGATLGRAALLDYDRTSGGLDAATHALAGALAGKVVGVEISGAFDTFLASLPRSSVQIRYYRTMGERDLDLLNGRLDATLEDESYIRPLLATRDGASLRVVGPQVIGGVIGAGEALALRPGDHALRARFDAALAGLLADGTIRRLQVKWFRMDATP